MRKIIFITLILASILIACSSQQSTSSGMITPEPNLPQATPLEPTQILLEPTATQITQVVQQTPQASATTTYRIIPGESQVSYEVGEVFINQNNLFNVAKGVTPEVNGEITVDRQTPQNSLVGPITIDISQFQSDSPRRDNAIRERFLESALYPLATFVPKEVTGLPSAYSDGEQINFQITGDLTVREVTKPAIFDVTIQLDGDTMTGEARSTILMSDFGVGPISIGGILNTEDEVGITFTFVARP